MFDRDSSERRPGQPAGDPPEFEGDGSFSSGSAFDAASSFMPFTPSLQPAAINEPPLPAEAIEEDEETPEEVEDELVVTRSRGANSDPFFGYLIAVALSIGLTPLIPLNADLRYLLAWGLLALFGILAWLLGTMERIERESLEDLGWGVVFGLLVATPILLVGGSTLSQTAQLMFTGGSPNALTILPAGAVLSFLIFTQPLAETLFFRGVLQNNRSFWLVGGMSSLWSIMLFMPMLDIGRYPVVAVIISVALVMVNLIFSYVRQRNGLAAAWLCQIVVNFVMFFIPYLGG